MKKQIPDNVNYDTLMQARKEGLVVQSEQEFQQEQCEVVENEIRRRQQLFDSFYGGTVTQTQRNEFHAVIDHECRQVNDEANAFYPKSVRSKMELVRQTLAELRSLGVTEDALADLIRPDRPLSRIYITADYRIFLPEYRNVEVRLRPLPKAVFLLFLRHPEGIVLKEIGDYFVELLGIYRGIMGTKFRELQAKKSLNAICNPLDNSLNEKISRIHEALRQVLDETIAAQYFITGKRREARHILIPQRLINWEVQ